MQRVFVADRWTACPFISQKTSIRDSFQDTNAGHGGSDGEHRGNAVRLRLVLRQVSGEKYEGTVRPSNRFLPSESSSPKSTWSSSAQ